MPLVNKTFSDIITFSRASSATMFDSSGTLVYAPMNLLTYSEQFDNAAWTKSNATITADATTSPDGTATADKLIEALDVNLVHTCLQGAVTVVSLGTYTATVFVKADTRTRVRIGYLVGGAGGVVADANLSAGTIGAASAFGGGTAVSSSIQAINNGWFRISVVGSGPAGTSGDVRIELLDASGNRQYNGDGVSGVYIWGAQLNQTPMQGGVTADLSTYYPTTSAAYQGPRLDYDPATLAARGLLIEEQRTNLLTQSEEFNDAAWTKTNSSITANATTAPSGTVTADKLVEALDTNLVHQVDQTGVTVVSLATYTASVFVKADTRTRVRVAFIVGGGGVTADANLTAGTIGAATAFSGGTAVASSIQAINNGWYRISVTGNGAAGTSGDVRIELLDASGNRQYNGDGTSGLYIWGAQLEAGAFPTSYIPTTTTALTRSADVASVDTLSPWYNATEGTIYAEAQISAGVGATPAAFASLDDTTTSNRIQLRRASPGNLASFRMVSSAGSIDVTSASGTLTGVNKMAAAFTASDQNAVNNGTVFTGITSIASLPTVTRLLLGDGPGSLPLNGHLRRITYYPRRLSDAELQAITA
jgi:hypothetical protein